MVIRCAGQPKQLYVTLLRQGRLVFPSVPLQPDVWVTRSAAVKNVPRLVKLHAKHTRYGLNTHADTSFLYQAHTHIYLCPREREQNKGTNTGGAVEYIHRLVKQRHNTTHAAVLRGVRSSISAKSTKQSAYHMPPVWRSQHFTFKRK